MHSLTVKSASALLTALVLVVGLSSAGLALSFQTTPILGTGASSVTGDLVMITGPTPTTPNGDFYYDVDGNVVLGPTIPHYSMVGDPLYGVGSPSMTTFWINPNQLIGGHWTDTATKILSGSGVYTDAVPVSYRGIWSFLGNGPNAPYSLTAASADGVTFPSDFIMLQNGLENMWLEDAGDWTYTEKWWHTSDPNTSISYTANFRVVAVPEPVFFQFGALMGLSGLGVFKLRRR